MPKAKKSKKPSSISVSPVFNLEDVDVLTKTLRDRLDDPTIAEHGCMSDQVKKLGDAFFKCSRGDALRYATQILNLSTVETLIELFMSASPKQGNIDYYYTLYALFSIWCTLEGPSDIKQRLSQILAGKWRNISEKLWDERRWDIDNPEEFYRVFGHLCREIGNSVLLNRYSGQHYSGFDKILDDDTLKLLAYYWKRADNAHSRNALEAAIGAATVINEDGFTSGPTGNKYRFLERLWMEFGGDPASDLFTLLMKRLQPDPDDRTAPVTGEWILACLSSCLCTPIMEHQYRALEMIVNSSDFWDQYTAGMIQHARTSEDPVAVQLIPITYTLRVTRAIQSLQQPLLLNLAGSSFFDYLDEIAGQDLNKGGEGWKTLYDMLVFILYGLERANEEVREAVAGEMPRTRLLHFFATATDYDPYRNIDRTEVWHIWQFKCWRPLLEIYALLVDPNQCYRRGCNNEGTLKCTRCKTKYCSRDCQLGDWSEHKLICKDMAKIRKMEVYLESQSDISSEEAPNPALLAMISPLFVPRLS